MAEHPSNLVLRSERYPKRGSLEWAISGDSIELRVVGRERKTQRIPLSDIKNIKLVTDGDYPTLTLILDARPPDNVQMLFFKPEDVPIAQKLRDSIIPQNPNLYAYNSYIDDATREIALYSASVPDLSKWTVSDDAFTLHDRKHKTVIPMSQVHDLRVSQGGLLSFQTIRHITTLLGPTESPFRNDTTFQVEQIDFASRDRHIVEAIQAQFAAFSSVRGQAPVSTPPPAPEPEPAPPLVHVPEEIVLPKIPPFFAIPTEKEVPEEVSKPEPPRSNCNVCGSDNLVTGKIINDSAMHGISFALTKTFLNRNSSELSAVACIDCGNILSFKLLNPENLTDS